MALDLTRTNRPSGPPVRFSLFLSEDSVFGGADDVEIGHWEADVVLASGKYVDCQLYSADLSALVIPMQLSGTYCVILQVDHAPSSELTDPDPTDNHARCDHVLVITAEDHADNYRLATAVLLNTDVAGTINPTTDLDYFKTILLDNYRYRVFLSLIGLQHAGLSLYGPDGVTPIAQAEAHLPASDQAVILFNCTSAAYYYASVSGMSNSVGSYSFRIEEIGPTLADLAVSDLKYLPLPGAYGQTPTNVSFTVANRGPAWVARGNPVVVAYFLSRNAVAGDDDDIPLGQTEHGWRHLAPDTADVIELEEAQCGQLKVPALYTGKYYLGIRIAHSPESFLHDPIGTNDWALVGPVQVDAISEAMAIARIEMADGVLSVTCQNLRSGAPHDIECCADLALAQWSLTTGFVPQEATAVVSVPVSESEKARFYRLVVR